MKRGKIKKYPQVRLRDELYEDIKAWSDKKGLSIGEAIEWAWKEGVKGYKKIEFPSYMKMREMLRKEVVMELEDKIRSEYEGKIKDLEEENKKFQHMIRDASFHYEELNNENKELMEKIEELNGVNDMLKKRVDELENMVKEFETLNVESLKEENNKLRIELLDLRNENDNLRRDRDNQAKEIKWFRDAVCQDLKNVLDMDSVLDIKPAIVRLMESIKKKAEFELKEKYGIVL